VSVTLRRSQKKAPPPVRQGPSIEELRQGARKTAERLGPYANSARDTAADRWVEARKWAAPRLEDAAHAVQESVAPRVSSALSATAERVEPVQVEASKRGRAAVKALKGKKIPKRRRWPIAVACFALGSIVGAVVALARSNATPLPPSGLGEPAQSNGPATDADTSINGRFPTG